MRKPTSENRSAIALELEVLADLIANGDRLAVWALDRWWGRNDAATLRFAAHMVRNPLVDVPYDDGREASKALHPSDKVMSWLYKDPKGNLGNDWHL
jgi:hypothetical protein